MKEVVILGAGISGIAAGYFLEDKNNKKYSPIQVKQLSMNKEQSSRFFYYVGYLFLFQKDLKHP